MIKLKLFITAKCNWRCSYCFRQDWPLEVNPKSDELIYKFLPKICEISDDIFLTGGEIGTMKPSTLEFIFESIKDKMKIIRVATNGSWFKTPSYKKYGNLPNLRILHHCVQDLSDEIQYPIVENGIHDFVITEDNWTEVEGFLKRYPDITFYPLFDIRKSRKLSMDFYAKMYEILKDFDNIPDDVKKSTKIMSEPDTGWFQECLDIKPLRHRVDFNAGKITTCCLPASEGIELSNENLDLLNNKAITLPVDERVCNYCVIRWLNNNESILTVEE